jgi:hypothetical protein
LALGITPASSKLDDALTAIAALLTNWLQIHFRLCISLLMLGKNVFCFVKLTEELLAHQYLLLTKNLSKLIPWVVPWLFICVL